MRGVTLSIILHSVYSTCSCSMHIWHYMCIGLILCLAIVALSSLCFPLSPHTHTCIYYYIADTTGEYSIYTSYENSEMMFHISTLLPFTPANKQQVLVGEREREREKCVGKKDVRLRIFTFLFPFSF